MLKSYRKFEIGEIEDYGNNLNKKELTQIEDYLTYRKARGLKEDSSLKDLKRLLLQIRAVYEKPLTQIDLKTLRELLSIINSEKFTNNYLNKIKANFKNYLKFTFPDWSIRFSELEDIRLNHRELNEERINNKTLFKKEDIEQLVKSETKNFWRAFLLTQYEGGLRTKEARFLKWSDIKLNIDEDLSEVNIFATKTKKARTIYVKEATHYLKLLKQEQENLNDKGVYVFHTKHNKDKPVEKYSVNEWFRKLTMRVLGREGWNYLLRHSRATDLYGLAEDNKISKDTAIRFMGHSEDMSKTYNHPNPNDVKKMLKNQVYHIEDLPPETKHKLELELEKALKEISQLKKENKEIKQDIKEIPIKTLKAVMLKLNIK